MPGLDDFRANYPQYNDMTDSELANALYKKHYSDMPRQTFDAKLGIAGAGPGKIPQQSFTEKAEQFGAGLEAGVGQAVTGIRQLKANLQNDPEAAEKVRLQVAKRNQEIAQRGGLGIAGAIGEALPGMAAAAAVPFVGEGMGAAALGGAAGGMISGLIQPTTSPDYWSQKAPDALMGAAFGAAGGSAVGTLGAFLKPNLGEAQKELIRRGVPLLWGQQRGGILRQAEEAMKSIPILSTMIANREVEGLTGFRRSIWDQALEPIGVKLSPTITDSHLMAKQSFNEFSSRYDPIMKQIKVGMDSDLAQDLSDIRQDATELPPDMQKQFNQILKNRMEPYFSAPPGAKRNIKDVTGALREFAGQYLASGDPDKSRMGKLFAATQRVLNKAMWRQNPQFADQLKRLDAGWAMLARAQEATSRRATSAGDFTANDLLSAVRSKDKTVRHYDFAQGNALLQLYAEMAQKVLPGKVPDSGTPLRYLWDAAILSAAGMGAHQAGATAAVLAKTAGTLGGGAAMYSKPAIALGNILAKEPGPVRKAIGSVVRKAAPSAGALVGGAATTPYGGPQQ